MDADDDAQRERLGAAVRALLRARAPRAGEGARSGTICPSDAARAVGPEARGPLRIP